MFFDVESQLEILNKMFKNIKGYGWQSEKELLYGYFFVDKSVEKLEVLGNFLVEKGYEAVGIFELEDDETENFTGEYMLHIEKVEIHNINSIALRNIELSKLAQKYDIENYDGFDVGKNE